MADARRKIRSLADQGFSVGEITARFNAGLNEIEYELVWLVARQETRRARSERWAVAVAHPRAY